MFIYLFFFKKAFLWILLSRVPKVKLRFNIILFDFLVEWLKY